MPLAGTDLLVVRAGCFLFRSNSVSCTRGCYTSSDSLTDFHSLKKIEYKSSSIGNDCQKVGYLGKEVYNTLAYIYSLI